MKLMEAKLIISKNRNRQQSYVSRMNKEAYEIIGKDEMVFDKANMRIREPMLSDTILTKINHNTFSNNQRGKTYEYQKWSFHFTHIYDEDICGIYSLEREGDWIYLIIQK